MDLNLVSEPVLSVVLPVRNGMPYFPQALSSLCRQNMREIEIIVVDDHSTDGSSQWALSQAAIDSRISVLDAKGAGLVAALNTGFACANSDFIARMDADDVCGPSRFAVQMSHLRCSPDVAAVGGSAEVIDANGDLLHIHRVPVGKEEVSDGIRAGSLPIHASMLIRREAFQAVGGYRSFFQHAEDFDLWLRIIERLFIDNVDQIVMKYRSHATSVSKIHAKQQFISGFFAARLAEQRVRGNLESSFQSMFPMVEDIAALHLDHRRRAQFFLGLLEISLARGHRARLIKKAVRVARQIVDAELLSPPLVGIISQFAERLFYREAGPCIRG